MEKETPRRLGGSSTYASTGILHKERWGLGSDEHWELGLFNQLKTMHSPLAPLNQAENTHVTHICTEVLHSTGIFPPLLEIYSFFFISAVALSHEVRAFINLFSILPANLCPLY